VEEGHFLPDLFWRINAANPLRLPPLRERPEDVPLLAAYFLAQNGTSPVPADIWDPLVGYDWPGNVRQLEGFVETLVCRYQGRHLSAALVQEALTHHDSNIPRSAQQGASKSPQGPPSRSPAPEDAGLTADETREFLITDWVRHLYRLSPDARQRFVKGPMNEDLRGILAAAVARYCQAKAGVENKSPLHVYRLHFRRPRVGAKRISDLVRFDRAMRGLLKSV
jgi:DNA-binding NtrC family response regulator